MFADYEQARIELLVFVTAYKFIAGYRLTFTLYVLVFIWTRR